MTATRAVEIRLPRLADLPGLLQAFLSLPITHRTTNDYHLQPVLSPVSAIRIDFSAIESITPDALAFLHSFVAWIDKQKLDDIHWTGRDNPAVAVNRDPRSDGHNKNPSPQATTSHLLAYERDIPRIAIGSQESRAEVREIASDLTTRVIEHLGADAGRGRLGIAVAEFIWEGLLNIAEHAHADGDSHTRAWLCVGLVPAGRSIDTPIVGDWLRHHQARGAASTLELSLADCGVGIASTLGLTFLKRHHGQQANRSVPAHYWELHDRIIEWALSPFGSRKTPEQYSSDAIANAWRGLYKVTYRLRRCGGLFLARSGLGAFGTAAYGGAAFPLRLSELGQRHDLRALPGTLLRCALPIPVQPYVRPTVDDRGRVADISEIRTWLPIAPPPTQRGGRLAADQVDAYAAEINGLMTEAFRHRTHSAGAEEHLVDELVGVVHPGLTLGTSTVLDDPTAEVIEEDDRAAELTAVIGKAAVPGVVPLHFMLGVSDRVSDLARDMFAVIKDAVEGLAEPVSSIVGFANSFDGEIRWFIRCSEPTEDVDLALSGQCLVAREPTWFADLRTLYPMVCSSRRQPDGRLRLSISLPNRVGPLVRTIAFQFAIEQLSSAPEGAARSWFWKSSHGSAEVVRTVSNRYVEAYANVYALCVQNEVVDDALCGLVRAFLPRSAKRRTVVVPASRTSAYILARRIINRLALADAVIVHPDDVHKRLRQDDGVVVFTDLIYSGTHLHKAVARLTAMGYSVQSIVCIDARSTPPPVDGKPLPDNATVLCRWPFPPPVDDSLARHVQQLTVDPLTNELLEPGAESEVQLYTSLVWRRSPQDANDTDWDMDKLPPSSFRYGLTDVGGRTHIVQCPTSAILLDAGVFGLLVRRLCDTVDLTSDATDIVLFARDESTVWEDLPRIAEALRDRLRETTGGELRRISIAPVLTTRVGDRQTVRHHLAASIAQARVIGGGGQLSLLDNTESERTIGRFEAIFIDNSAITGRALREFAVAVANLPPAAPTPRRVTLFPIVDKLSPSQERFLRRIPAITGTAGNTVSVDFAALIQLRVRSFRRSDTIPILAEMKDTVRMAADCGIPDLETWARSTQQRLDVDRISELPITTPLAPDVTADPVSTRTVYVRHLLALVQQGVPVVDALLTAMDAVCERRDMSLLTVFALEPALLRDDLIERLFGDEIQAMALLGLGPDQNPGTRLNALLVLAFRRRGVASAASGVAAACCDHASLFAPWLSLTMFSGSSDDRQRNITATLNALDSLGGGSRFTNAARAARFLRGALIADRWIIPTSDDELYAAISRLMRESRTQHGDEGFGSWWSIRQVAYACHRDESFQPTRFDLPEGVWTRAEHYLKRTMLPGFYALGTLAHRHGRFDRLTLRRELRLLIDRFEQAREYGMALVSHSAMRREFVDAWFAVMQKSLDVSADWLLCRAGALILGDSSSRAPLVDMLLTDTVLDPIATMLHALQSTLGAKRPFVLLVKYSAQSEAVSRRDIEAAIKTVYARWQTGPLIPLAWNSSHALRQAYKILADNMRNYAADGTPIILRASASANRIDIVLRCDKSGRQGGEGRGNQQIANLLQSIGGRFAVTINNAKQYETKHTVATELLRIAPIGPTEA